MVKFIYHTDEYADSAGRVSAIMCFCLGTILLLAFLITNHHTLISIGLLYVLFCVLINSIIVIVLLLKMGFKLFEKRSITSHLITLLVLLLNIPITIGYISILIHFYNII